MFFFFCSKGPTVYRQNKQKPCTNNPWCTAYSLKLLFKKKKSLFSSFNRTFCINIWFTRVLVNIYTDGRIMKNVQQ